MFPKKDHEFTAHVDHRILRSQPGGQQAYPFLLLVCVSLTHTHTYFPFFISLHSVHIRNSANTYITHTCTVTLFTCTWTCESRGKSPDHSSTSQQAPGGNLDRTHQHLPMTAGPSPEVPAEPAPGAPRRLPRPSRGNRLTETLPLREVCSPPPSRA